MDITQITQYATQIAQLAIVGAFASLFVETLKSKLNFSSTGLRWISVIVSLVLGTLYFVLKDTNFLVSVLGVLGSANVVYNYVVKPLKG